MKYYVDDIIDAKFLSFDEWHNHILFGDLKKIFPNNCFPSIDFCNEYINKIHLQNELNIKTVLRRFLVHSCNFGSDNNYRDYLMKTKTKEEVAKYITEHEHIRRLFLEEYPWEGITWIIDLLPNSPNEALKVLDAYFIAHLLFLPDNALYGINDSSTIISAKYIEYEYPQQIFLSLSPIEFEWLIEELFKHKGYETTLTPQSHDGGIDIIAEKKGKNEREKILIQCKRYEKKLTVKEVREFNGVINDYPLQKGEKVTKGILITSADFTNVSLKEFSNNYSIELVNYKTLSKELNRYLGRNWYHRRNNIFRKKIKNANA